MTAVALAQWSTHVNALDPTPQQRTWLTESGSLTAQLIAHSRYFRVRRIRQARGLVALDEQRILQLPRRVLVQQRNVVLECDGQPVVFAHTSVPLTATASDWPLFGSLGERSLGSTLFGDPLVQRGALEFARLSSRHPLMRRLVATLGAQPDLLARRCLYRRRHGILLVCEIFLPAIVGLVPVGDGTITV
ncbi:chorismate--pyruvate lyase family protein [Actimicrobium sp. CCI2.3]|uniref:chorismate--pyruvate lyase family protein n=1 Tax=Actimicrobium sp. CCI2.3 TaxID=3048616 RepID=UPI002AB5CC7A|nr:chorismate lyase [Actimicrobium sp. CCI2.3]MDY7573655.1 chorismate lyase [Actimicrobium sp. CCI2.3]MEB0021074.1 chorismate lyase [Actimicrobium sp. CCI2.3]